jgi:LmbE family N-acetylglucosaminyl deacetylase
VTLVVDDQHLGTSEAAWLSSERISLLQPLSLAPYRRVVIIAPHPDDEVFGAAGLLLSLEGAEVHIVAVTDGEASHPEAVIQGCDLRLLRARESAEALHRLGWGHAPVTRLGLPDSAVTDHSDDLIEYLSETLTREDLCIAPWRHDGHPDHDACGRAATEVTASKGAPLLEYLVWAWHWLEPEASFLPLQHFCSVLRLSRRQAARKRWATHAFASQIRPLGLEPDQSALLPTSVVRRFWRPFEVFIAGGPS